MDYWRTTHKSLFYPQENHIMSKRICLAVAGCMLVGLSALLLHDRNLLNPARAADPQEQKQSVAVRPAETEAIQKLSQAFTAAFEKGDAKAIASSWTEQGEYVDDNTGEVFVGRDAIEKAFADLFKQIRVARLEMHTRSIRFPSRDTALEEGYSRLIPRGSEMPSTSEYSVLYVREDGNWKAALVREWGADARRLEDITWLLGDWVANLPNRKVEMKFKWNDAKSAIMGQFTTSEGGRVVSSSTQRIALDPRGNLHSWSFDQDGGHGQALWFRDGNCWLLDSGGVHANGLETASMTIINRLNNDAITWRSIDRMINGEPLPPTDPIKIVRVKAR
jgi:uncharacterized protein (TIGR02246 family)